MMEIAKIGLKGEKGKQKMPGQFTEIVRPDIIRKAVRALQANRRQKYGTDPRAGKKFAADLSKRRRKYRGSYGSGQSRIHRKIMSRRGLHFNMVGAHAPQARGGFIAHPPKAEKIWTQKMNKKERRKAIRSAAAATLHADIVKQRGHKVPDTYPFVLDSSAEALKKTVDVKKTLISLGFADELARASVVKIRAGQGKLRGRKHKRRKGLLLVVSEECELSKSAHNLPGINVVPVRLLNAEMLAPGGVAGRATLFTTKAIEKMDKERLFL